MPAKHLTTLLTLCIVNGDTPLADLVSKFEEGSKLLKHCQVQLKEAELKIEQLNLKTGQVEAFDDADEE